jgi:hypothetical protein
MFWALMKRNEDIEKARQEGWEEGLKLGRKELIAALREQGYEMHAHKTPEVADARLATSHVHPEIELLGLDPSNVTLWLSALPGFPAYEPAAPPTGDISPIVLGEYIETATGRKALALVQGINGVMKLVLVDEPVSDASKG